MSIKTELTVLKANIQSAKDKLYTNLTEKGVTDITTSSTLDEMADSVSSITTGTSSGGGIVENTKFAYSTFTEVPEEYCDYINNLTNMSYLFSNCNNLTSLRLIDTSKVTNMAYMLSSCRNLTNIIGVENWDVSNVTKMSNLFNYCSGLTSLDLSSWDVSNVTDMSMMFNYCSSINTLNISNWNPSSLTSSGSMFQGCSFNKVIADNTILYDNFYRLFPSGSTTSVSLVNTNTSNMTNMSNMFNKCSKLKEIDLSSFDTSNVISFSWMFQNCSGLTSLDLSSFDTSKASSMSSMFEGCSNLQRVDGYISFKSYSASTMASNYFMGYTSNSSLRKITFKDIGYNSNSKQFNMSYATNWGVNNTTITDARQSLIDSLITYSYDRATASYSTCTVTLAANTKAQLTESDIAAITAKGFTIA